LGNSFLFHVLHESVAWDGALSFFSTSRASGNPHKVAILSPEPVRKMKNEQRRRKKKLEEANMKGEKKSRREGK
jgi:hypothetical protein